jgi:hypothetical protein
MVGVAGTVADVALLLASSMSPGANHASGSVSTQGALLIALAVGALAGGCLFLLFRRGSIGDRARHDEPAAETDRDQRR